jgi:heat shock protein HspQ
VIAFQDSPQGPLLHQPGQIVFHLRYQYRGVVVQRDDRCRADDAWYYQNNTQPDRSQPWYHVLVDDSSTCTYVAAENLIADMTGMPITHPWVDRFFSDFVDGCYVRNDQPWPP